MRLIDSEKTGVQDACLQLLAFLGIPAYRSDAASVRSGTKLIRMLPAGCPDITAILPKMKDGRRGVYLGIECKRPASPGRPKGRIRDSQRRFSEAAKQAGAEWLFVYDVGELMKWIHENLA